MASTRRILRRLWLPALVGLLGLAILGASRSVGRDEVERRLLEDSRGSAFAARIQSVEFTADLGAGIEQLAARYVHLPGDGSGAAPLVLLHGTPGSLVSYGPLLFGDGDLARRAGGRSIWLIEQLGHGFAPATARPCTFDACSAYAAGALAALGVRDAVVVGHSYGGEVALRLALDRPDLAAALVLVDSSGIRREPEEFLPEEVKMREWSIATWGWMVSSAGRIRGALEPHFAGPPPPAWLTR